jgi:hypothetical protein
MPRRSQLPPLALTDVDVMCLATWKRDADATHHDPFSRALNRLGVELLPAGQQWRLRCSGDEGEGILVNRREWETLRHAIVLDPQCVRAVVQACVDAQRASESRTQEIVVPVAGYREPVFGAPAPC